jgi:hypothetical protein
MLAFALAVLLILSLSIGSVAAPPAPFATRFHLAAHPWQPLRIPADRYLDTIEGLCRFSIQHQNSTGAIIDPFLHHEHQYATPYFAYAVGTLMSAGRAKDLLPHGIAAMEHATRLFAGGRDAIPQRHGEFFLPCLTAALELYEPHIPKDQMSTWRERMTKPVEQVINGSLNNWQTYAMKGQWLRAQSGLISRADAFATIERDWRDFQQPRFSNAPWFLYHDLSSDPDTLSVEAVGRGNLLALTELGYDGPSAQAIRKMVEAATNTTLWLQDPSGQVPANGRTDDHVWVDVGYQLAFEVMAERERRANNLWQAGQYRHSALLAFQNIGRWKRKDEPWAGSYFITKNHFDPALRVGYQGASEYSNYSGSLMFHLSEAYRTRKSEIEEQPNPSEIGGYAFALDAKFASAFANAGGMQIQANLRGDPGESSGNYWTPLGVVRFARANWETRLGPSDGALTNSGGVTFAPAFLDQGRWVRMADLSRRYEAQFGVTFVHPALVRCSITYTPRSGETGPRFRDDFTITPDGVLSEVRKISSDQVHWGMTWPVLENDGGPLVVTRSTEMMSTGYGTSGDRENFIALRGSSGQRASLDCSDATMRSTYGDLRPVRVAVPGSVNRTFIYPSNAIQPTAEEVRRTFRLSQDGFSSALGRVIGNIYVSPTIAGGEGSEVDLDGDGKRDATFNLKCGFILQIREGQVVAVETDRSVTANIRGREIRLAAFTPAKL